MNPMVLLQMLWSAGASIGGIYSFWRAGGSWNASLVRRTSREEFFYRYFRWHWTLLRTVVGIAWFYSALLVWSTWSAISVVLVVGLIYLISIPIAWLVMGTLYALKFGTLK